MKAEDREYQLICWDDGVVWVFSHVGGAKERVVVPPEQLHNKHVELICVLRAMPDGTSVRGAKRYMKNEHFARVTIPITEGEYRNLLGKKEI